MKTKQSRNINKTATTKNKIKKTIRATKLKQKQRSKNKLIIINKVIITKCIKPNKTNKQKYQTELIKTEQNKTNKTKQRKTTTKNK
jgi:hypothetical protein